MAKLLPGGGNLIARTDPRQLHECVVRFLSSCQSPAMVEPGEPMFRLREGEYSLEATPNGSVLEVWADTRVLRRRITHLRKATRDRLELAVEHFARKKGRLTLLDASAASAGVVERDATRAADLEVLRRWCERLFPLARIEQSSCGTDLENSLSPRFPRALVREGSLAMAVLSAPDEESSDEALAFGLVWLRYAQARWPGFSVRTLVLFVPAAAAIEMGLRLRALQAELVRVRLFAVPREGFPEERPEQSWGNLHSSLSLLAARNPADRSVRNLFDEVSALSGAEVVEDIHGGLHLEVLGLPVAVCQGDRLRVGPTLRQVRRKIGVQQLLPLVERVAAIRHANSLDTRHELYRSYPERWLEAVIRQAIVEIDPLIDSSTVRRQVSGFLGVQHSRTDLLALDRNGCLVILEIKAAEDIALPVQALDYYTRLRLHLERGEIQSSGLFPNRIVTKAAPRLLLVAPALQFHPTNETVLSFFESSISVRQIGVAIEWRKKLRVVFDHPRNAWQPGGKSEWQAISSVRSGRLSPP